MPVDIFKGNGALIDQDSDRKRKPPERHQIYRFAKP
jgi:hypothetical protein